MKRKVKLVEVDYIRHPFIAREDSTDFAVADGIFNYQMYKLDFVDKVSSPPVMYGFKPKFIIDGGANVGYASVYFSNIYPEVEKIVAIEPETDNFEILTMNLKFYPQVECLKAGLWKSNTDLFIHDSDFHSENSFITSEQSSVNSRESIQGITIGKIFRESGFKFIDILKLDVEGAEKEIFSEESDYREWLPFVKVLIIELHDRMKRGCSHNFFKAITQFESFFMLNNENVILIREDLF